MKVEKIYPSQRLTNPKFLTSRLLWPFYPTQKKARTAMLNAPTVFLVTGQSAQLFVAVQAQKRVWRVMNVLAPQTATLSWRKILKLIETAARQKFVTQLTIELAAPCELAAWFKRHGYQQTADGFSKKLVYHTGLVLGGGGAHGAYQIGAWQALQEKAISFDLIAGTSVGALNGALIAQNDVVAARALWEKIETSQVLAFTYQQLDDVDFSAQLDLLRNFITTALRTGGLSTEPLRELLTSQIDFTALKSGIPLAIVTTRVPSFTEVIVQLNHEPPAKMIDWLLASSAFFPLMAVEKIADAYYVDGGYRNNLPQDVALKAGATELITLDIHGPGIDRKVIVPDEIAQNLWKTSWNLGDLLLFQTSRCQGNLTLGYLETKRQLEDLPGTWYTFTSETELRKLSARLIRYLQARLPLSLETLQASSSAPLELICLPLLEQWGRWLKVSPLQPYSVAEFTAELFTQLKSTQPQPGPWTVQEQWQTYWQSHNFFSDYQQVTRLVAALKQQIDRPTSRRLTKLQLLAWCLIFLQEE